MASDKVQQTVIITGAAGGIGAATASLYNSRGYNVILADLARSREAAETLMQTMPHPTRAKFVEVDICNWDQMKALFKSAIQHFGSIDVVVANAGIMESHEVLDLDQLDEGGDLLESTEASRVIDINLKGTLNSKRIKNWLFLHLLTKPCSPSLSHASYERSSIRPNTGLYSACSINFGVFWWYGC